MSDDTIGFLLPFVFMILGTVTVFLSQKEKKRRFERAVLEHILSPMGQMQLISSVLSSDDENDETIRRLPIQFHSEEQREMFMKMYHAGVLSRSEARSAFDLPSDTEYEKPKREPRYAIGDDGELIAVTGDEKPKRGAL